MQKTYIPGYRIDWRRVETTHTRVGVNSHRWQISLRAAVHSLKPSFSVKNFIIDNIIADSEWIDLDPVLHAGNYKCTPHAHIHTYNHAHIHTLPDLAYKKMCLWTEKICRWFSHIHKHTHSHTQQVQCRVKLWHAQPKTTRDTYSITMSDRYSTTWIHCIVF